MSKSVFVNEYISSNKGKVDIPVFYSVVKVSLIDVLASREVNVVVGDYKDCLCKDSVHLSDYFVKCDKCDGRGILLLNGHELVCSKCKGEKYLRVHDCYLCKNKGKVLQDSYVKIKLTDNLKDNDEIVIDKDDYKLVIKIEISDKDDYLIKGNDIYYLRGVKYSKSDYLNKKNIVINTIKGKEYVTSEFKIKKEVRCIKNAGINGGDFYFIFENEVENEKKNIYVNVIINKVGYVNINDLIEKKIVVASECIALNKNNYVYIDNDIDEIALDEYVIKLNKLNSNDFVYEDNNYCYVCYLTKDDIDNDKKSVILNNEKINLSFKKNLREVEYLEVLNKGLFNKDGKRDSLKVKIVPYYNHVYKISVKKNKNIVYVDDYKYDDYRLVKSYKKSDYLINYISVDDKEKIYKDLDLIMIKRV